VNNGDLFGHLPVFLKSNAAGKSPNWTHFFVGKSSEHGGFSSKPGGR
jgi:hypothetical protein